MYSNSALSRLRWPKDNERVSGVFRHGQLPDIHDGIRGTEYMVRMSKTKPAPPGVIVVPDLDHRLHPLSRGTVQLHVHAPGPTRPSRMHLPTIRPSTPLTTGVLLIGRQTELSCIRQATLSRHDWEVLGNWKRGTRHHTMQAAAAPPKKQNRGDRRRLKVWRRDGLHVTES